MSADTNDLFKKTGSGTVTTLASPGKALGATSITVGATTNYPTDTGIIIAIRQVDTAGELIAGTYSEYSATVSSGTSLAIVATPVYGNDQVYPAGSTTQVYIPLSSYSHNKLIDGLLVEHGQDGTHHDITSTNATITNATITNLTVGGQTPSPDWTTIATPPNTVTYNGQRSYNLVFNGVDYTNILSPGQRLKTTRTVAAPTQCTSLNGTTQYWNKTSPNKLTANDNLTLMAHINPAEYKQQVIMGRVDGTAANGWYLRLESDGRISIGILNAGAANYRQVSSYQSVPLNKKSHIAATWAAGTVVIYLDGVSIPVAAATIGGTNPTTSGAGGDYAVGREGAVNAKYFSGKIAQAAVFNAVLSATTIRAYYSQGLIGNETNLQTAHSFDGNANDLNTTTPNDLTAQASAGYAADSPFGTQASGLISSTLDYGIIQKATFSTDTTVVVQVPEGCTIPTSGGVAAISYSGIKAPYGFPTQKEKWSILSQSLALVTRITPGAGIWYNDGGILTVPIGNWEMYYGGCLELSYNSTQSYNITGTLSTTNNTSGGYETLIGGFAATALNLITVASVTSYATFYKSFSVQTPMYFNISNSGTPANIYLHGLIAPTIIRATNAYL